MIRKFLMSGLLMLLLFAVPAFAEEEGVNPEDIERAGTYYVELVTYDDDGNEITKLVRVIVLFPFSVLDEENGEGIDASDIKIDEGVFKTLSHQEIISLARAHAWNLETGAEIPVEVVGIADGQRQGVDYRVTFATAKGTSITISVMELSSYLSLRENYIGLVAYDNVRYLYLSTLNVFLIIFLFSIILLVIAYLQRKTKEVEDLLYKR